MSAASLPIKPSQVFKLLVAVSKASKAPCALFNFSVFAMSVLTSTASPALFKVSFQAFNSSLAFFKLSAAESDSAPRVTIFSAAISSADFILVSIPVLISVNSEVTSAKVLA